MAARGKVSVDSSGGCEEITLIVIKNFEFVPVENTVDGSLPMAISGTLDEASVILSTDNDEVIVFGGDLVDATKFTLSGRYLKAGDRYVAIDGGALVVVETSGEATSGWILSGTTCSSGKTLNWFISMAARVRFLLTAPADAKRSR